MTGGWYAAAVQVEGLGCAIEGRALLAEVSLSVAAGESVALLGPSGAGKSMVLRCLLGLAPAGAQVTGTLVWAGRRIALGDRAALARLRGRGLALVPQAAAASLDPMRTVGRQLREVAELHDAEAKVGVEARLSEVGLPAEIAGRYAFELSGGQAQRVALALALACRPAVLLADEPLSSLDCVAQVALLELLLGRCAAREIALVLVSHDLALLAGRAMQAVVLANGRVVAAGALAELIARPREPVTAAMVAAARRGTV